MSRFQVWLMMNSTRRRAASPGSGPSVVGSPLTGIFTVSPMDEEQPLSGNSVSVLTGTQVAIGKP
jgi:hypothetical protein